MKHYAIILLAITMTVSYAQAAGDHKMAHSRKIQSLNNGRIVVFADKKEGDLKTDKSLKIGTSEGVDGLKMVETTNGVHACFIGTADVARQIVSNMVLNSNKATENQDLILKNFQTTEDQSSIQIEILSNAKKTPYIQVKIDHC